MVLQLTGTHRGKRSGDWPPGPVKWVAQSWELQTLTSPRVCSCPLAEAVFLICGGHTPSCGLLGNNCLVPPAGALTRESQNCQAPK